MQHEDDLRGLAKTMEFMRAVSIIFVVIHIYYYCFGAMVQLDADIEVVSKILVNFDRTAGLFGSLLTTKVFAVIFLALSCLGSRAVKSEKVTWKRIHSALVAGLALFFLNWWILSLPIPEIAILGFYTATLTAGYIFLLMAGLWTHRMLKQNLMDDPFNEENESFMQETRLMENQYSVRVLHTKHLRYTMCCLHPNIVQ
jgi:hypothetical protein